MKFKKTLAAATLALIIGATGCASNVPGNNDGNRTGERLSNAINKTYSRSYNDGSGYGVSRNYANNRSAAYNRATGDIVNTRNHLAARAGNAVNYNPNVRYGANAYNTNYNMNNQTGYYAGRSGYNTNTAGRLTNSSARVMPQNMRDISSGATINNYKTPVGTEVRGNVVNRNANNRIANTANRVANTAHRVTNTANSTVTTRNITNTANNNHRATNTANRTVATRNIANTANNKHRVTNTANRTAATRNNVNTANNAHRAANTANRTVVTRNNVNTANNAHRVANTANRTLTTNNTANTASRLANNAQRVTNTANTTATPVHVTNQANVYTTGDTNRLNRTDTTAYDRATDQYVRDTRSLTPDLTARRTTDRTYDYNTANYNGLMRGSANYANYNGLNAGYRTDASAANRLTNSVNTVTGTTGVSDQTITPSANSITITPYVNQPASSPLNYRATAGHVRTTADILANNTASEAANPPVWVNRGSTVNASGARIHSALPADRTTSTSAIHRSGNQSGYYNYEGPVYNPITNHTVPERSNQGQTVGMMRHTGLPGVYTG